MRIMAGILLVSLSLTTMPLLFAADKVEKVRNEKVLVTEETLAPGETVALTGEHPGIVVYVTSGSIEVKKTDGEVRAEPVKHGYVEFRSAETGTLKNTGAAALSFVRVEFLTKGLDETWGMTGLAPNYKVLIENRYARSYNIRIPAQGFEPQHTHHARVVVSIAGADLEHILPDGTKQPSNLKTGEIAWRPAATHIGHNMGHTDLWVIAIEPK